MEHRYILLKDSDGYKNLWKIIHETDDYYLINRCITNTAIQKESCYIKDGRLYGNEICNFYLVSYKESDEEYLNYLNKNQHYSNYYMDYPLYEDYLYNEEWEVFCEDFYADEWYDQYADSMELVYQNDYMFDKEY